MFVLSFNLINQNFLLGTIPTVQKIIHRGELLKDLDDNDTEVPKAANWPNKSDRKKKSLQTGRMSRIGRFWAVRPYLDDITSRWGRGESY